MNLACDIHLHTTFSDGHATPREVVDLVCAKGLTVMAVTDHDTVAGVAEAIEAARQADITCLSGVELSTYLGQEIHILGYNVPYRDASFLAEIERLQQMRQSRVERIVTKLRNHGIKLVTDERLSLPSAGRSHIAELLVEQGFVRTKAEAFDKYLGKGAPCFVEGFRVSPTEAVRLLRQAGAVPVLAHPFRLLQGAVIRTMVQSLLHCGLMGIEVYYPNYSPAVRAELRALAVRNGLICTGGSDFHSAEYGASVGEAGAYLDDRARCVLLGK